MSKTDLNARRVRCRLCPRAMRFGDYAEHFNRFHAVDFVTGLRNPYVDPSWEGRPPSARQRKGASDIEGQLFIGYPTAPPMED